MSPADFYVKQLKPLVGGKVIAIAVSDEDEFGDQFFGLHIEVKADNEDREVIVWFLKDDEGNGPGSFEIEELT